MPQLTPIATHTYRIPAPCDDFMEDLCQYYRQQAWQPFTKRIFFQPTTSDESCDFIMCVQRPLSSAVVHFTECRGHIYTDADGHNRLEINLYKHQSAPSGLWQQVLLSIALVSVHILIVLPELLIQNPEHQGMLLALSLPIIYFLTSTAYQFVTLVTAYQDADDDHILIRSEIERLINSLPNQAESQIVDMWT